VWKEGVVLEDSIHLTFVWGELGDVLITDKDLAFPGNLKAGYHPQQSGFPTTAGTQERKELSGFYRQTHVVNGNEASKIFGKSLNTYFFQILSR